MLSRMLPFWVQWLFAAGGIVLLIAIVFVLWTNLTDIHNESVDWRDISESVVWKAMKPDFQNIWSAIR